MNIREALLSEHSKHQAMAVAGYVAADPERFAELMRLFLESEYRTSQRAALPVNYCATRNPELIHPYFERLVDLLGSNGTPVAIKRNIVRQLQFIDIPGDLHGKLYSLCIDLVDDTAATVAVRVFAMTVAAKIAKTEPDLMGELRLIVEKHLPHATAGFRARARRILCI